jgi:ABC-type branched-subunit amino acid transport system permease subunit
VLTYLGYLACTTLIYVILGVSLNLIMGFTGIFSVAHAAFMALGAYATGVMTLSYGWNFFLALPLGMAVAAAVGAGVAYASLRLRGNYYVIASFAFQVIAVTVLLNWTAVTRGPMGLPGIPKPTLLGHAFDSYAAFLLPTGLVTVLCCLAAWRLARAPYGRILRAIREDEAAVQSLGKSVTYYKISVFVAGSAMAAAGGSLLAAHLSYISPQLFGIEESMFILSIVVIGGLGNLWGPWLGAPVMLLIPEALRFLDLPAEVGANLRQMVFGALLVVFVLFRPGGLVPER